MQIHATELEQISPYELLDVSNDTVVSIHIDVFRRNDGTAHRFGGDKLLVGAEPIATFEDTHEAFNFIRTIDERGLVDAILTQVDINEVEDDVIETVGKKMHTPRNIDTKTYIDETGCENSFNLNYSVFIQRENSKEKPVDELKSNSGYIPTASSGGI